MMPESASCPDQAESQNNCTIEAEIWNLPGGIGGVSAARAFF
jgi:hypothetical protein